ncbi:MAG: glycosyltransferase [Victivallaceae bacterium]|nr:glycosyltransferase [Victivallaceae bacterium]
MDKAPIVVISRFNLAYHKDLYLSAEWLEVRLALLEHYTAPALAAQTDGDFVWLVLVSPATPEPCLARIGRLTATVPQLRVVRTNRDLRQRKLITGMFPDAAYVVSARLDTDDSVSADYIAAIRRHLPGGSFSFVNFDDGLMLDRESGCVYRRRYLSNPFIAVCEPVAEMVGIYGYSHSFVHFCGPVVHVAGGPYWLQVVHGGNWMNRVHGVAEKPEVLRGRFGHLAGDPVCLPPSIGLRAALRYRYELLKMRIWAWIGAACRRLRGRRNEKYRAFLVNSGKMRLIR